MAGQTRIVDAREAERLMADGSVVLVDVREAEEWRSGHIPGASLVSLSSFDPARLPEVSPGKTLLFYCRSGVRCGVAADYLRASGYRGDIDRLHGGISAWAAEGLPIV